MKEKTIKIEGFTSDIRSTVEMSIVLGVFGIQGSGKSRLIATAPDPIGIIPLDRKTRWTVAKYAEQEGKTIVMPEKDFIRHAQPMELAAMDDAKTKKYFKEHTDRVMDAAYRLSKNKDIRTIAVDTFSQFCEDLLFKHYGRTWRIMPRDRGPFNQDVIDFINAISNKHVVLTHKAAEIWAGPDEDHQKPTGKYRQKGFGDLGYHCNVLVEMKKNLNWSENGNSSIPWKYSLDIKDCQANPELEGPQGRDLLTDDMINFTQLACAIYPDADPKEFM